MWGVAEYPVTTIERRGAQHLWHTARNEAIAKGGKGVQTWTPVPASVILKVYLAPLVAALFVLLVLSGNVFASRGNRVLREPSASRAECFASRNFSYSRLISCTRDSSVVLEGLASSLGS